MNPQPRVGSSIAERFEPSKSNPQTPTEIPHQIRLLTDCVDSLGREVEYLRELLNPVMAAQPPQEAGNCAGCPQAMTPLGYLIQEQSIRISLMISAMRELRERTQL